MATTNPSQFCWRKSSRSGGNNECVEIGTPTDTGHKHSRSTAAIRDSKNPHAGALVLTQRQWATFREAVKDSETNPT